MYDRATTARTVENASRQLIADQQAKGWPTIGLRYYSAPQIERAVGHLNDLWDFDKKKLTRQLKVEEQQFISNERKLCALDFHHWLRHYAWIVNWRKEKQRFTPNVAQTIVMALWAEDEAKGNAIWMQQLKARRLGVSTISELNVCNRYQFHLNSNCIVASAAPGKTVEMAGMIKYALDNQPWWLLPQGTPKIKHGIPVAFPDLNNTLAIEAGNQFTGVARGGGPNIIHLSELCEWQDPEDIVDASLMRAVIDDPNVFGILESTALGIGNWWHKTWLQNKKDWAAGRGRVRPIFLPWYVGTDIYPAPAWLRKTPIPANWIPDERTIRHAEKAREYVLAQPLLFEHLAKGQSNWQMSREQMWYREVEYQSAREKKQLHIFLAEMCADEFEAFQIQQNPLLDQEILIGYQERTRLPIAVYTIVGPEIPPQLVAPAREWDRSKPTITVTTHELTPNCAVKYQLIPLRFETYDIFDEQLKLLIWEWPTFEHQYGVGVDCSEGLGEDNAAIEVIRESTINREPGQVAEWVANTVTAFQLWPLVHAIGCLYSQANFKSQERKQCRLAIETWTNGAACQNELQKRGWSNFHPHYYPGDTRKPKRPGDVQRIGVMTNQTLRAHIQDLWLTCLKEEAIDCPSPYLVNEIVTLQNNNGKAEAIAPNHDDRWMSLGFPLYSLHVNKPPSQQFTRRRVSYQPGLALDAQVAHPVWTPPDQAKSFPVPPRSRVEQRLLRDARRGPLARYTNPNLPIRYR